MHGVASRLQLVEVALKPCFVADGHPCSLASLPMGLESHVQTVDLTQQRLLEQTVQGCLQSL